MDFPEQINNLIADGKLSEAVELIVDLPEEERSPELTDTLAHCYISLDMPELALEVLEQMPESAVNTWYRQYIMGTAMKNLGRNGEAIDAFECCLTLNPPEEAAESCLAQLSALAKDDMQDHSYAPEMYSEEEMDAVEAHIEKYYGKISSVFHELYSPDIHVDICVIKPDKEKNRDYYTLITMGMGAHLMNVPEDLAESKLERAEMVICLPSSWKIESNEEKWYWPIRLLKVLARLPIRENAWLGWGHSIDHGEPYAENTGLCSCILTSTVFVEDAGSVCPLSDGSEVNFYLVLPIYKEELDLKLKYGAKRLFRQMNHVDYVLDPDRPDSCAYVDEDGVDLSKPLDEGNYHASKVAKNGFPLDPIVGYNHLAVYLRWCIEHDMMRQDFTEKYSEIISSVKDGSQKDLRAFIRDEFDGELRYSMFNGEGLKLAKYYFSAYNGGNQEPYFPADIDDYAEKYFGTEKYNCEEFNDEAYLFVPFDEDFYNGMKKYLDRTYEQMKNGEEV